MTPASIPTKATGKLAGFEALCAYLRKHSGLVVDGEKSYLIENKVLPIVERERLQNLGDLVHRLERGDNPRLAREVVQAMTINETYFFRDKAPFAKFSEVMLPQLVKARTPERALRIWCAACSTGQEPYSLAMLAAEAQGLLRGRRVEIIATDLAEAPLAKARAGIYSAFEVQRGLPENLLQRYFRACGAQWELADALRTAVTFKPFNLLNDYGQLGTFDIIFCRNVLIYFDVHRKADILSRFSRVLAPDGYLVLGSSENILARNSGFSPSLGTSGVFQPSGAMAATPAPSPARKLPAPLPATAPGVRSGV
jgi:chemotaxis protein methyltransferase CheR